MDPKKVSNKPKASRKLLTIEQKKEIISAYERGIRIVDLAAMYCVASSSIATILKKKEEIKAASVAAGVKTLASQSQRNSVNEEMEKLLVIWMNERQMAGDALTQEMICSKARMIYASLKKIVAGDRTSETEKEFKGSRGWFEKFKRRSGIFSVITHGEGVRVSEEEAEKFDREFHDEALHLGVNEEYVEVLVEEHPKDLTTKDFQKFKRQLDQERDKEDKEEVDNEKGRLPTEDIKKMLHYWEEFQSLASKWHPDKTEVNRLCALVEDKCLNHFKNILRNREVQSTSGKRLASPLAKRRRPATEVEEICFE